MLNVNELHLSKHKRSDWIKINMIQLFAVYRRHTLGLKIQTVKVKGWGKVSGKQTIRKLEWLYWHIIGLKTKYAIRNKRGHFITMSSTNDKQPQTTWSKLTKWKGIMNNSTKIVGHLNYCCCLVTKFYQILCDPVDCTPPRSSVHGAFQARILEWIAIFFSRGSQADCLPQLPGKPKHLIPPLLVAQMVKESACNAGDLGLIPGLGRSPGEGNGYPPTLVFLPREFHGSQRVRHNWATNTLNGSNQGDQQTGDLNNTAKQLDITDTWTLHTRIHILLKCTWDFNIP